MALKLNEAITPIASLKYLRLETKNIETHLRGIPFVQVVVVVASCWVKESVDTDIAEVLLIRPLREKLDTENIR